MPMLTEWHVEVALAGSEGNPNKIGTTAFCFMLKCHVTNFSLLVADCNLQAGTVFSQ